MTLLVSPYGPASAKEELNEILRRPLITGASVSADWSTASPGKRLARRYTQDSSIRTVAHGGRPGRETFLKLNATAISERTSILAIDFFFWDSTLPNVAESLKTIKRLVTLAKDKKIPIVLGEIPELLPGRQIHRPELNRELERACAQYSRCYLMPFVSLHRQVLRDGFLEIKGQRRTLPELVPDGLHLSDEASDFLADLIKEKLSPDAKS